MRSFTERTERLIINSVHMTNNLQCGHHVLVNEFEMKILDFYLAQSLL